MLTTLKPLVFERYVFLTIKFVYHLLVQHEIQWHFNTIVQLYFFAHCLFCYNALHGLRLVHQSVSLFSSVTFLQTLSFAPTCYPSTRFANNSSSRISFSLTNFVPDGLLCAVRSHEYPGHPVFTCLSSNTVMARLEHWKSEKITQFYHNIEKNAST